MEIIEFRYALEKGEKKRLSVRLKILNFGATVYFDGTEIMSFMNFSDFQKGAEATLPDGSIIHIRFRGFQILIERNGLPLGLPKDIRRGIFDGISILPYFLSAYYVANELLAILFPAQDFHSTYDVFSFLVAFVYLIVATLIRRQSRKAVVAQIPIIITDLVTSVYLFLTEKAIFDINILIFLGAAILFSVTGLNAVDRLQDISTEPT